MDTKHDIAVDVGARAAVAAAVALLVGLIDEPVFGIDLAWWFCGFIGVAMVFLASVVVELWHECQRGERRR